MDEKEKLSPIEDENNADMTETGGEGTAAPVKEELLSGTESEVMEDTEDTAADRQDGGGWQFEAEAPTLHDEIFLGDGDLEIEIPKENSNTASYQSNAEAMNKNQVRIDITPIKFAALAVIVVAVIAVLVVLGVRYYTVPNGKEGDLLNPAGIALTVGDTDVSIGMYNYYYANVVDNYETYAAYGYYDLDTTSDYSKQYTTDDDGNSITWLEKFQNDTVAQIQYILAYYEEALNKGLVLTDEQKETISTQIESLEETASEEGVSVDEYIADTYGDYCTADTLRLMLQQYYLAESCYNIKSTEWTASEKEISDYFVEHQMDYYECTFAYLQMIYDTTDETTMQSAREKAEEYCNQITDYDSLKALFPTASADLIQQYVSYGYFEDEESAVESLSENLIATITGSDETLGEKTVDWLFSDDTEIGSTTYYADEDYGYIYVILKTDEPVLCDDEVYSVRHILVTPESEDAAEDDSEEDSEETEEDGDTEEYTDEEWAAAKAEADKILEQYKSGERTEAQFAALAEEYSDDTESTSSGSSGLYGGLYQGVTLGQMVSEFENWATDDARAYGDTEIVKSDYGYHIMFFIFDGPEYEYGSASEVKAEKENAFKESFQVKIHNIDKTTAAKSSSDSTD